MIKDLDGEIWIDVVGLDGIYDCSNLGRIKSLERYVSNGKGERLVKERIIKQWVDKVGRSNVVLSYQNINYSMSVPFVIFYSFNRNFPTRKKTECVMHKNKIFSDNRLCNLSLEKQSYSHSINYEKKLLPHLKKNNDKRSEDYKKVKNRKCKVCDKKKKIELFRQKSFTCLDCRKKQKSINYYNRKLLRND